MPINRDKSQLPNPPTWAGVTTPAVPGSTTPQLNNSGVDVVVYLNAGTLTVVALTDSAGTSKSVSAAGANTMFVLPNNWSITLTYSVAPTWFWQPY